METYTFKSIDKMHVGTEEEANAIKAKIEKDGYPITIRDEDSTLIYHHIGKIVITGSGGKKDRVLDLEDKTKK